MVLVPYQRNGLDWYSVPGPCWRDGPYSQFGAEHVLSQVSLITVEYTKL